MPKRTVSNRSIRVVAFRRLAAPMLLLISGCQTFGHIVVDRIGDNLSDGGSVFTGDPDPDLVRDALPFGLKTYESLLAATPKHRGLLLASARGFAAYAYLLQ